jgi:hypothetical protein
VESPISLFYATLIIIIIIIIIIIKTGCGLDDRMTRVRIPAGAGNFSL